MTVEQDVLVRIHGEVDPRATAEVKGMRDAMAGIGKEAMRAAGNVAKMGALAGGALLVKAVHDARDFGAAMGEVSTIVDTSAVNMEDLRKGVLEASSAVGQDASQMAKALYQTISAGVDAAESVAFLGQAARAATAGVADTATAVDHLTNVMNAYGKDAYSIQKISDITFKTVEKGKTTFSELSQNMGQVLPFASQLGVSLEDLFAATASLTLGGINTAEASTQLKNVLASVIQPTGEASRAARRFGIDLSAAAVQNKGFIGFLQDIQEKTGGSSEKLSQLFPNIRGLTAVLSLAGKQSETFARIQGDLANSVGATDVAFNKIASGDDFKFNQALNDLKIVSIELGTQVLPVVTEALKEITGPIDASSLRDVRDIATGIAEAMRIALEAYRGLASVGGAIGDSAVAAGEGIRRIIYGDSTATSSGAGVATDAERSAFASEFRFRQMAGLAADPRRRGNAIGSEVRQAVAQTVTEMEAGIRSGMQRQQSQLAGIVQ